MPTSVSFSKICQIYKYPFIIFKDYSLRKFSLGSRALLYRSRPSCNKDNDDGGSGGSHDNHDDDDVGCEGDNFDDGDGPGLNIMVMKMVLVVIIVMMVMVTI